ncbi:MAG: peptidoglycan bridge formation glycyltransferase FemA/FemB family protein [Bacteroides sp.]|nr:peptidoglycan bridge formation glycyltransferase FemA/FemB family protein [Prevotella sp.]MCM1407914.1 peptidoglycan bridge formation glycyltransferase FemA/FemB family protein [Treponema brennaborense]MCM1469656.1 peptidoglycan bridge formation glycyltransferase FemA/FemB family protein [Bacteroides sp.]
MFAVNVETVSIEKFCECTQNNTDCTSGGHFLQSAFWASFKAAHGWKALCFAVTFCCDAAADSAENPPVRKNASNSVPLPPEKSGSFFCFVLTRRFAGCVSIAYMPAGPDVPEFLSPYNPELYFLFMEQFAEAIKPYLPKHTLFIRFDPPVSFDDLADRNAAAAGFKTFAASNHLKLRKSPADVQPPDTVLLPIDNAVLTVSQLLENMKPKWRYNIRLAEKKGVVVRRGTIHDISVFYDLYLETAKRDGIAVHAESYYRSLFELAEKSGGQKITLYVAEYDGVPIASIITLFTKSEAIYLYGASSNLHRNYMPAYLLQWTAITDAMHYGSKVYDFYGIPPVDDKTHPMYGLYRFKTGFGGNIVHRIGSIDAPLSIAYPLYILLEKLRSFWYKTMKKRLAGR